MNEKYSHLTGEIKHNNRHKLRRENKNHKIQSNR